MKRPRFAAVAVGAAAFLGVGAFAMTHEPVRTDPAPVDLVVDAVLEAGEAVPEAPAAVAAVAAEIAPEKKATDETASEAAAGEVAAEAVEAAAGDVAGEAASGEVAAKGAAAEAAGAEAGSSSAIRYASVLSKGRTEWDMTVTVNDRVEYWIDFLTGRNHDRTRLWLEREGRYGGMIRARLRDQGMPEDLLYLGMIESGLSPRAYSRAHAAGMWQFIAETGRRYGLEVTAYVDRRRDPIAATDAALGYLSDLYDRFGSWYLAAAAYNSGENRVERVLRQRVAGRKGDDGLFWMIDQHLPRETRDYVPLMLAAGHIAKDPEKYGFENLEYQEPLAYEEMEVPGGITLRAVAAAAEVDVDAIQDLNPHLLRGMTPPGKAWPLRIPVGRRAALAANLDAAVEKERLATVTHRVRRGETLSHVAQRYGVAVDAVRAANGAVNPRRLQVGQRLVVPVGPNARVATASATASWTSYRVRRGDTLWAIARRHGVSVRQLRSWNGIGNRIYPGQKLRIAA